MSATARPGKRCQLCETTENLSIGAFPAGAGLAPGCRAAGWSAGFCWASTSGLPARHSNATIQGAASRLANTRMERSLAGAAEKRGVPKPQCTLFGRRTGMPPFTIRAGVSVGRPCSFPEQVSALALREQDADGLHEICSTERRLLVLPVRIELTTSPLPRECSTTELRQPDSRASMSQEPGDPCHRAA